MRSLVFIFAASESGKKGSLIVQLINLLGSLLFQCSFHQPKTVSSTVHQRVSNIENSQWIKMYITHVLVVNKHTTLPVTESIYLNMQNLKHEFEPVIKLVKLF